LLKINERDRHWTSVVYQDEKLDPTREQSQSFPTLPEDVVRSMYATQDQYTIALLRMLGVDLALRSWRAENGEYPDGLGSITATFVEGVPDDPFTGNPFCYRPLPEGFVLYSPGPTCIDHGGTFSSWWMVQKGAADLCLDNGDYGLESQGS
jgi:hypothetical protein